MKKKCGFCGNEYNSPYQADSCPHKSRQTFTSSVSQLGEDSGVYVFSMDTKKSDKRDGQSKPND
jgi:hypothetical protein